MIDPNSRKAQAVIDVLLYPVQGYSHPDLYSKIEQDDYWTDSRTKPDYNEIDRTDTVLDRSNMQQFWNEKTVAGFEASCIRMLASTLECTEEKARSVLNSQRERRLRANLRIDIDNNSVLNRLENDINEHNSWKALRPLMKKGYSSLSFEKPGGLNLEQRMLVKNMLLQTGNDTVQSRFSQEHYLSFEQTIADESVDVPGILRVGLMEIKRDLRKILAVLDESSYIDCVQSAQVGVPIDKFYHALDTMPDAQLKDIEDYILAKAKLSGNLVESGVHIEVDAERFSIWLRHTQYDMFARVQDHVWSSKEAHEQDQQDAGPVTRFGG